MVRVGVRLGGGWDSPTSETGVVFFFFVSFLLSASSCLQISSGSLRSYDRAPRSSESELVT